MSTRPMTTSTGALDRTRILYDLKPALDGYAGIPQESRLLFRGLCALSGCEPVGLIQHGARRLRPGTRPGEPAESQARQINRWSRVVVSLRDSDHKAVSPIPNPARPVRKKPAYEKIGEFLAAQGGQVAARLRRRLTLGEFDAALFQDFVWRTFFSKTLGPADKALVTAADFRVLRPSRKRLHQVGLAGRRWSATPAYPGIDTMGFDILLAQTPFPGRPAPGTRLVVRYHDAVPVLMPHTIGDTVFHQASHFYALQDNVRTGAWFSCVSEATRRDLLRIFPEAEPRTRVIHNISSEEYFEEDSEPQLVPAILRSRLAPLPGAGGTTRSSGLPQSGPNGEPMEYLLMVSTIEPRKNHLLLTAAWERLKYGTMPHLQLVVVGNPGWGFEPVMEAFRPWVEQGEIFYLRNVPTTELRMLYRHAAGTICPSLAEGFDYSGVEAMRSGGIVISSDIEVHREVYGDASAYFDPYCAEDAARVIGQVLGADGRYRRERLREAAASVATKFTAQRIMPQWDYFFSELMRH